MDSWNNENREVVKIDLSGCLVTSAYVIKLETNAFWINGVLELNLRGNPLMEKCASALASLLKNPHCCLKTLILTKCQLGLHDILTILQALANNTSIEELDLSENVHQEEVNKSQHESVLVNADYTDMEVANSEDDANEPKVKVKVNTSSSQSMPSLDGSCVSSFENDLYESKSKSKSTYVQELSYAVSRAKRVRLLELSGKEFSEEAGETLYGGWSTDSRGGLTKKYVEGSIIHLSVEPYQCCNIKPCCTRF
ncbi:hypothetical protein L2E82_31082 [Cichorium intybus]|uniref:Uncharacterized protein n=1 Tax=Cichorium intybus TaxID=13427 RepID=A0ACB9D2I8_CICIN|nr:hypothetical protein L2E82_31082 [Cichorium intybus]